jgi:flavin reductase (DIM6/NTAB) family NADH-FMN oxidoreductase RutF
MAKVTIPNRPFGPFPAVLVGTSSPHSLRPGASLNEEDVDGRPNYTTAGACGVVSMEPVLYVSLRNIHLTTRGIKESGFFSVNIPSADQVQRVDYCGMVSGRTTDKSGVFTSFYDERGTAPMISECPMNMLCKVIQTIPLFDFEFFLGEIVAAYLDEQCLTDGKPDPKKINPMILMGNNYWGLGQAAGAVFKEGAVFRKSR